MCVSAPVRQGCQRLGLLKGPKVFALDVLDQREFDDFGVVDFPDDDREFGKADLDGRLVATLACDDLVAVAALTNDERLDNALLRNRCHEL